MKSTSETPKKVEADSLEAIAKRLEEYANSLRGCADALRSGEDERDATFDAVDIVSELAFDTDELSKTLGLGYVEEKSGAILLIAGTAHALRTVADTSGDASITAEQAKQMSRHLAKAAMVLDSHANRCGIYGGICPEA